MADSKQELIDEALNQIVKDVEIRDLSAVDELLKFVPTENLLAYLEEQKPAMTYRKLLKFLNELPDERLDDTVSIYYGDTDEFLWPRGIKVNYDELLEDREELDQGHAFLYL